MKIKGEVKPADVIINGQSHSTTLKLPCPYFLVIISRAVAMGSVVSKLLYPVKYWGFPKSTDALIKVYQRGSKEQGENPVQN